MIFLYIFLRLQFVYLFIWTWKKICTKLYLDKIIHSFTLSYTHYIFKHVDKLTIEIREYIKWFRNLIKFPSYCNFGNGIVVFITVILQVRKLSKLNPYFLYSNGLTFP